MEKEKRRRQTLDKSQESCPTQRDKGGGAKPKSGVENWNRLFSVEEDRVGPLKGS
jgi:hypothetical protein